MHIIKEFRTIGNNCNCGPFCDKCVCSCSAKNRANSANSIAYRRGSIFHQWIFVLTITFLPIVVFLYSTTIHYNYHKSIQARSKFLDPSSNLTRMKYKYELINSTKVCMAYDETGSSYTWFVSMRHLFRNMGADETPKYPQNTPKCHINTSSWGPIKVYKTRLQLKWVESQHRDVKLGGFYAPAHCRSHYRVAILVPYRNRKKHLIIFLYYIHRLLKKQLLEYRVFVIEQYGKEKWNKGTLYNIAYLETQRFGHWDCLIFHDVDLIPEDERIMYNCSKNPLHLSPAVEHYDYILPYRKIFGGVTGLTPAQYEAVNGYSNFYWNWGAEDDDMFSRLMLENYTVWRSRPSIGRYTSLPHKRNERGLERSLFLFLCNIRYRTEGLRTTNYSLISVSKKKLFTHILADVNPNKLKLDSKSLFNRISLFNSKDGKVINVFSNKKLVRILDL